MANSDPSLNFTHDHRVHPDGRVEFACSMDLEAWPWLALPAHHPIVTQNLQYWASVGASSARGTLDGSKWTALTWTKWRCGPHSAGFPTRGEASQYNKDGRDHYLMRLFDTNGTQTYEMHGTGVVFRTRDFESWRAQAKTAATDMVAIDDFPFSPARAVGSEGIGPSLLGPLMDSEHACATGLISVENAMPPHHPYMTGSGDHVNATHLAEAAHQFLHLVQDGQPQRIIGGEMRFNRYVELGRPFVIALTERTANQISTVIKQGAQECSQISLNFEPA